MLSRIVPYRVASDCVALHCTALHRVSPCRTVRSTGVMLIPDVLRLIVWGGPFYNMCIGRHTIESVLALACTCSAFSDPVLSALSEGPSFVDWVSPGIVIHGVWRLHLVLPSLLRRMPGMHSLHIGDTLSPRFASTLSEEMLRRGNSCQLQILRVNYSDAFSWSRSETSLLPVLHAVSLESLDRRCIKLSCIKVSQASSEILVHDISFVDLHARSLKGTSLGIPI